MLQLLTQIFEQSSLELIPGRRQSMHPLAQYHKPRHKTRRKLPLAPERPLTTTTLKNNYTGGIF